MKRHFFLIYILFLLSINTTHSKKNIFRKTSDFIYRIKIYHIAFLALIRGSIELSITTKKQLANIIKDRFHYHSKLTLKSIIKTADFPPDITKQTIIDIIIEIIFNKTKKEAFLNYSDKSPDQIKKLETTFQLIKNHLLATSINPAIDTHWNNFKKETHNEWGKNLNTSIKIAITTFAILWTIQKTNSLIRWIFNIKNNNQKKYVIKKPH